MEALCLSRLRDKGLGARSPLSLCLFLQSSTGDTRKKPTDLKNLSRDCPQAQTSNADRVTDGFVSWSGLGREQGTKEEMQTASKRNPPSQFERKGEKGGVDGRGWRGCQRGGDPPREAQGIAQGHALLRHGRVEFPR